MDKIDELLTRGVVNIIPSGEGIKKLLESGRKLNVYLGIDPTMTKIHLGHAVPLRKLQYFAELGHKVTFLIGDFTALIGDTSDKDSERPILSQSEIENNFKTYKKQAEKFLDFSKITVVHNSEWLKKLTFTDIIKLCQHFSVGDFVGRELIKKRLADGKHVRLDETLYPVMQGYDSYFLDTDIQLGGADQTFNMQAGRILQKDLRNKESFILVNNYLTGTDGRKMSKSWGNAVWVEDSPDEMFGKLMSLRDELISEYLNLATSLPISEVEEIIEQAKTDPMNAKKLLSFQIVKELCGEKGAIEAKTNFEKTFQKRDPEFQTQMPIAETLSNTIAPFTSLSSISEAKRQILQGSVVVNGKAVTDPTLKPKVGQKIQIGKRIFGIVVEK